MSIKYKLVEIKPTDKVSFLRGNREVNDKMVGKIMKSMAEYGILTCITVTKYNSRYFIIDGQHRYSAAKRMGLSIPAIVIPRQAINVIIDLNTIQKNWGLDDYADFFATNDDKDLALPYATLRQIREQTGINYTALVKIYSTCSMAKFKRGELVLDNFDFAERFMSYLVDISNYVPFFDNARFILGYIHIAQHEHYEHDRMMAKLKLNHKKQKYPMDGESKPTSYGRLMQDIYNMHQTKDLVMFRKW